MIPIYIEVMDNCKPNKMDGDKHIIINELNRSPFIKYHDVVKACGNRWTCNQVKQYINTKLEKVGVTGCEATMPNYHDLINLGKKGKDASNICNDQYSVKYEHSTYAKVYRAWKGDAKDVSFKLLIVSAWNKQGLSELAA